jgi:phosphotransacetylase
MPLAAIDQLYRSADLVAPRTPIAVVGADEPTVLQAVGQAVERGWITPILCGSKARIREVAEECRADLAGCTVVNTTNPAMAAVAEVRGGRARMLMKGRVPTPALMQAVLDPIGGLRTGRVICQIVLMEIHRDSRGFLLADTGICIQPTLTEKLDILRSAITVAQALGVSMPLVAIMAATEVVTKSMPETLEAQELESRNRMGELGECVVQGPISFDLAYRAEAAERKSISGRVVGAADILLFPNLVSANLTVKAIMYTAECRFGGVLCGAMCPVVFMSRADTVETRLNSLALGLAMAFDVRK